MSQNVIIRGVTYTGIEKLDLAKSGGGTATYRDPSGTTAAAGDVLTGKKIIGPNGEVNGSMPENGAVAGTISTKDGAYTVPAGHHNGSGTVEIAAAQKALLIPGNIRKDVTVLGVTGTVESGGGSALNFSVEQYPESTDISQETGEENELAVLTNTTISGWTASSKEPTTPTAGLVWIKLGTSSKNAVNILLENEVDIFIQAVFQYESGAWVKKKGYLYQTAAWHDLDIFLFDNGDQCTSVTGGWIGKQDSNGRTYIRDNYIELYYTGSSSRLTAAFTSNRVDLSGYTKLKAKVNIAYLSSNTSFAFGLYKVNNTYNPSAANTIIQKQSDGTLGNLTLELDISEYKTHSDYYVGFRNSTAAHVYVYEAWLE